MQNSTLANILLKNVKQYDRTILTEHVCGNGTYDHVYHLLILTFVLSEEVSCTVWDGLPLRTGGIW